MSTIFTMRPNRAYDQILGVDKADQRWCAFNTSIKKARLGEATKFGMTVWNYHPKFESNEFLSWAITRDPETQSYWYKVVKKGLKSQRNRNLLIESLCIAAGATPNSARMPMKAILKDQKSNRCAPNHVFNIEKVLMQVDESALWLKLGISANGVGTEVKEYALPPMIPLDSYGSPIKADLNPKSQRTEISDKAFEKLKKQWALNESLDETIASISITDFPEDDQSAVSEILRSVWCRGSQHAAFRRALKTRWNSKCAVHGISCNDQLIASHIIPWSKNKSLRGDINNGLLLSVPLDKLFDKGYITFDRDGMLIKSVQLDPMTAKHFGVKDGMRLGWKNISEPDKQKIRKNLKWHEENWFEKAFN